MASRRNKNPNQMALPGMEELSHPGAKVLAANPDGMFFHQGPDEYSKNASISFGLENGESYDDNAEAMRKDYIGVANMKWNAGPKREPGPVERGEIENIHVDSAYRRQGIGTAMWGIGRQMLPYVKPQHSVDRTEKGDAWAKSVGGKLPKIQKAHYNPMMDN